MSDIYAYIWHETLNLYLMRKLLGFLCVCALAIATARACLLYTSRCLEETGYKEGVAGDTQPVRPGGRWGGGVPSWRKSVSEAPIAASVTSVSRMRRERRASRRRSSAGSVCRFGNRGMLREDDPEERREATEDEFKVFHFS